MKDCRYPTQQIHKPHLCAVWIATNKNTYSYIQNKVRGQHLSTHIDTWM